MTSPSSPLLLLASASPRRSALLAQIGLPHRVHATEVDESPLPAEAPESLVARLALAKTRAGVAAAGGLPVLGADTIVVLDGRVLNKPRDAAEAAEMLMSLGGRTHAVLSAVALQDAGGAIRTALASSRVTLRAIAPVEALRYWDSGEPRDKAGGYAIQGYGAVFIRELTGSYSGVMGLPLFETAALLREAGISWTRA
ncbi:MAG: nucleoside triphosphate pyrophosphatase [Pseudomonadota bacterium]